MRLSFYYPNLPVSFDEAKNDFWLVHRPDAFAVEGDGAYERLAAHDVLRALFAARLDDPSIEDFLLQVSDRDCLFECGDGLLSPRVRLAQLVDTGDVIAVRESALRGQDQDRKKVREEREVAREVASIQRTFAIVPGRRSLLVSGADYGALANRDGYRVLGRAEADRLLVDAASRADGAARAAFEKAATLLAPDWRLPKTPQGLVLLLDLPRAVASRMPEAAVTPSQMRAMIQAEQSVNLEVVVQGLDDEPLDGVAFSIAAPDSESYDGDLGRSGKTSITSIKKGPATVTLAWAVEKDA